MAESQHEPPLSTCIGLVTDLYELTMAASYFALGMNDTATFSLFIRKFPDNRSFVVAAGLSEALRRLAAFRFDRDAAAYLETAGILAPEEVRALEGTRFTGDVWAMREGQIVFPNEPILEVSGPLIEAQLVETMLVNALHFATLVATKAARCVMAAPGKSVVEFGLRRTPGIEGGLIVARASWLAGFEGTSNVLAGRELGLPLHGTVAHSFVEAFADETSAFRAQAKAASRPLTFLVDTYDTERGVEHAIAVAQELRGRGARLAAIRLDSGDLDSHSRQARRMLDDAGLGDVRIACSGGLDEYVLDALTRAGAPIDGYGVGTRLGMSADAPVLDMAYKLVAYAGRPALKLSEGKATLVGPKQVWRRIGAGGIFREDLVTARDEPAPGEGWVPLLEEVVHGGQAAPLPPLDELRRRHQSDMRMLPPELRDLGTRARYPVACSRELMERQRAAVQRVREREGLTVRHTFEDHTGEVMLRVEAPTLPELFAEAGRALGEIMVDVGSSRILGASEVVVARAIDESALLAAWLNELIFLSEVEKKVFLDVRIEHLTAQEVRAVVRGIEPSHLRTAVKAATLHRLAIERAPGGFVARIVLDV